MLLFLLIVFCLACWGGAKRFEKIEADIRRIDAERFDEIVEQWRKSMAEEG